MGGNLAKTPLTALFCGALLPFVAVLFPYSQGYMEAAGTFVMPKSGYLSLILYGLYISIIMAIVFAQVKGRGMGAALMLAVAGCGLQWIVPLLRPLMLGAPVDTVTTADTAYWLATGCIVTILTVLLMTLLYRGEERSEHKGGVTAQPKYKIYPLGLVIRLLVLPVIFMVLYYLLWYFLLWRTDAVRDYFGQPELRNFMGEIIDILIYRGFQVVVTLLSGLAYALFGIPLLLQFPGKRIMFIVILAMLYASSALLYLIPSPFMPDGVRMAYLLETFVVMALYGAVAGILLHTAIRKEGAPVAAPPPRPSSRPGQTAAKAVARPAQTAPDVKK